MANDRYWNGFAVGALVAVGAGITTLFLTNYLGERGSRIIRLEKSVQIGRSVEEVFQSWCNFDQLARSSSLIRSVIESGNRWYWVAEVDGRRIEWDAEIEQFIPNQAIGWKSLSGPKHTGRISFSPLKNDTLVTVTMNYMPPVPLLRVSSVRQRMQQYLEQALRDFKAALEGKGQENAEPDTTGTHFHAAEAMRSTGTFGTTGAQREETQNPRFGGTTSPVEYTRPPEAKT